MLIFGYYDQGQLLLDENETVLGEDGLSSSLYRLGNAKCPRSYAVMTYSRVYRHFQAEKKRIVPSKANVIRS